MPPIDRNRTTRFESMKLESGKALDDLIRKGRLQATHIGLVACLEWILWCRENGWSEESLLALEGLFWKYRDKDGKLT